MTSLGLIGERVTLFAERDKSTRDARARLVLLRRP